MRMSPPARAVLTIFVMLGAIAAAPPASAEPITFRFDLSIDSVDVNPGDVFDPYVAANFPTSAELAMYVTWDPDHPVGSGGQHQGAITEMTVEREGYRSRRRAAPGWNFMSTQAGDSFTGFADLGGFANEPALPFQPYYFQFAMEFPFGTLQPGQLPGSLPSQPLMGDFLIALGTDYYVDKHFVTGRIESVTAVPEPTSLVVFGAGLCGWMLMRRRKAVRARHSQIAPTDSEG